MYLITVNTGLNLLFNNFPPRYAIVSAIERRMKQDSDCWDSHYRELMHQVMVVPNWDFIHREMEDNRYDHQQSGILHVMRIKPEDM